MKMPLKVQSFLGKLEKSRLFKRFGRKTWWGFALVLILAIGGSITYFQMNATETQTTETKTLQTTVARKSSLVMNTSTPSVLFDAVIELLEKKIQ